MEEPLTAEEQKLLAFAVEIAIEFSKERALLLRQMPASELGHTERSAAALAADADRQASALKKLIGRISRADGIMIERRPRLDRV